MTRTKRFLQRLKSGDVLLADGATGTAVQEMGIEIDAVSEQWVLNQPDRIRALHQSYIDAGADIILTATFGGTRFRLENHGLAGQVTEVNRRAAELAREMAGDGVFVAGDMGPTGQLLAPLGPLTPDDVSDAYAAQAEALTAGGADFLLIETMSDLGEAQAAIAGARRASSLPIFCTFSFDTHGRTMMGIRPATAAAQVAPLVAGLGANCGRDPGEFPEFMRAMRAAAPGAILWAKPNAGLPRLEVDRVVYDVSPAYMADVARDLHAAGAQVIGGCCGTNPAHIAAMAEALKA
ncbi:MAG: homocysteine S-methyltransferase family protein [Anaerolineae bacterium]|nr:homocysteine S-methyltransferase family protein [Anaerolineae bacterium]